MIQRSEYETVHILYDDLTKHYEYFGRENSPEIDRETPGQSVRKLTGELHMTKDDKGTTYRDTPRQATRVRETETDGTGLKAKDTEVERGEQILEIQIGTINISGITYGYRGKYMKTEEELLKVKPGDKLREVTEMMKTQGISLMTLTDTHLSQGGMEEVGKFLQQEGLAGGGIAAVREMIEGGEYSARRRAGIYFIWDPTKLTVDTIKEVYASRVASVSILALDSGNSMKVYGVYMPVRNNKTEKIEEIWGALTQDITDGGDRNFVINGDFNAETEAWISKAGRSQKEEDVIYQGVIEDLNLVPSVTEEHTFERARTQIDNILVPIELLHNLKAAYTSTGVREKDHKMVLAVFAWDVKGDKGERRPTRRHTDKFQEKHWLQYEQILQERTRETREKMNNKEP
eukprot:3402691-Pleurochrysis_carterae.AAC.1